jgi:anti-sigma factor ChrR (cupin superfamily)
MTARTSRKARLEAGDYALGTLQGEARRRFERRMADDPGLRAEAEAWEARLAPLAEGLRPVAPPKRLWTAIAAKIDAATASHRTIRAGEGGWTVIHAGVAVKDLHVDRAAGRRSFLMRLDPGARLPGHDHAADEECLMLEGEAIIGRNLVLRAGDYHVARKGVPHATFRSKTGALIYISAAIEG